MKPFFPGSEAENEALTLGSSTMTKHFEEALVGANAGEELTITDTLGEDHSSEIAGKTAQYTVNILRVTTSVLPELNEDFIKSLDVKDGTEATLRTEVTDNLQIELQNKLTQSRKADAFTLLSKANPFDVPHALVKEQASYSRDQMLDQWNIPEEARHNLNIGLEPFLDRAKDQVRMSFLVSKIVDGRTKLPG